MKRLVSGIKPTGEVHIGNYAGAMRRFVGLAGQYESYVFLADYHALTTVRDAAQLKRQSLALAAAYLAIGLDPKKTVLFRQSDVPEHAELAWILNCVTPMPTLQRAHAFKDAVAKKKEINAGIFDYPVLMAADILMYRAAVVPVAKDQVQHVEIAREIADRFHKAFGAEVFTLPEPLVEKGTEAVPGIDGQKMSKSYKNVIPLFASAEETKKRVMQIVTDSRSPAEPKDKTDTLYALHKVFSSAAAMKKVDAAYEKGGLGYKDLKELLADEINTKLADMRATYDGLITDPKKIEKVLAEGGERARAEARKMMLRVRSAVGLS